MDEKESVEKAVRRGGREGTRRRYTYDERMRAVKLHLEEGFTEKLVGEETGIAVSTISMWVGLYRRNGEMGLRQKTSPRPGRRLARPVIEKILEMKRGNPFFGVKRIADGLRRWFFLEASPETVRKTLHEADLMSGRVKARRNLVRPRYFERATPNQMWQSDIFTFRLGGKYAYAVAFLDDYSRYVVNLELYRSPTAECVVETYRVAVGEYSPPKEMLTDRGPQYFNWRGKSRFASELTKDRVAHLVSRPQHPMTLGKVERFWASMWQEFLVRAQFDSFESARERLKLWVKYYNHRRPHQGIGGLCPADRFFEIQGEVKKTIQSGIQDNLLEMALRGQPKAPFYLIGRMEGQSVVLKAEKGKLKLSVDDKEMTYDLEKEQTAVVEKLKKRRTPPKESSHTAPERAQAVLAIWTDRVKITEVVKTLGVTYSTLSQWQDRAMEGMLQALEPRVNLVDGAALSPRIRALMDKRQQQIGKEKLRKRLEELQEVAPQGKPPSDP